jgi:hypothetical protein
MNTYDFDSIPPAVAAVRSRAEIEFRAALRSGSTDPVVLVLNEGGATNFETMERTELVGLLTPLDRFAARAVRNIVVPSKPRLTVVVVGMIVHDLAVSAPPGPPSPGSPTSAAPEAPEAPEDPEDLNKIDEFVSLGRRHSN